MWMLVNAKAGIRPELFEPVDVLSVVRVAGPGASKVY